MTVLPVIASVSGGKDSTAMCLHLREREINYTPVFIDTGWESEQTYNYIENTLPEIIGEITTIVKVIDLPDDVEQIARSFEDRMGRYSPMIRRILKYGSFPSRKARWCTVDLKVDTMKRHISKIDEDVVNAVGIRAEESSSRSQMGEWEYSTSYQCEVWRPIIGWTLQDVIDIHHRHGVAPCSLYLKGASRVGCWPCIYARKAEIRRIGDSDPERIALIRDLEEAVAPIAAKRRRAAGKPKQNAPAWFQARTGRSGACWPIDKVVSWSRTAARRVNQFEMFAPTSRDSGCMRWGLCDTGADQ
ncbi:phosphoadenosine phosphosulfate reductase family protein [Sulfitobacter dubius]|uniref:phosphoadenosine phosphosulfate reductase family protein n=1 Tax=Sulfitobacter dubius TaxID=218673 RepID=UPI0030D88D09